MRCHLLAFTVATALGVLPAAATTPAPSGDPTGGTVSFRITDGMDRREVEESVAIYIDRKLAGNFRLDAAHPQDALTVTLPAAASYEYAMCGRVLVRTPDGSVESRRVDTTGTIFDPDGRTFAALTVGFTHFYLGDATPGRLPTRVEIEQGPGCTPVVS
ncbi:MAG TPA: hypothetical protein VME92_09895 [Acetobacteraceae bacterium]|nr:hypothetical protein [Acetobacteraceae bacterium]